MKKLLKRLSLRTLWHVLAGFLPGVIVGLVVAILGLVLLAPEPNLPPPHRDNAPGDVTIQLSQGFLNTAASQNLTGAAIPIPPFGSLPLENIHAQTEAGNQLFITGQVNPPLTGPRQVLVGLQPCVSKGRPAFDVTSVQVGGQDITSLAAPSIQQKLNSAFKNVNPSIPNEHLSRMLTTASALVLVYSNSSDSGQPACHAG